MSIREHLEKIKTAGLEKFRGREIRSDDLFTVLIILLVGFGSFGLGRLSKLEEEKAPVTVEYDSGAPVEATVNPVTAPASISATGGASGGGEANAPAGTGGRVLASKNGTKYYLPWCAGAQKISEKNRVWFNSGAEAERAGLQPAANCKGL